jgi:hypothetical protein
MKSSCTAALTPFLLVLCSCAGFNQYGTARTLAPGEANWAVSVDGATEAVHREKFELLVPVPRLRHRRGLAEDLELDLALGVLLAEGALKYELAGNERFALAVAPGLSLGVFDDTTWLGEVHLPVVADVVVAPWLVLVPHVGAGWGMASDPDAYRFGVDTFQDMTAESDEEEEASERTSEPFLLGGLGLYFRLSDSFALQPAVTVVYRPETDSFVPRAGISAVFGTQPTWR